MKTSNFLSGVLMADMGILCLFEDGLVCFVESFEEESKVFDKLSLYNFNDAIEF